MRLPSTHASRLMTRDDAAQLNILFLQIVGRLNQSAAFVRDKDGEAEWHLYRRSVGKAMMDVFDLAEVIWDRFPELKPKQAGGTYEVDPAIYEPLFYDWDDDKKPQG